jgi:hypothetical protein
MTINYMNTFAYFKPLGWAIIIPISHKVRSYSNTVESFCVSRSGYERYFFLATNQGRRTFSKE